MLENNEPGPGAPSPRQSEISENEIDEALVESFPASDPPQWTLGDPHANPKREEEKDPVKPEVTPAVIPRVTEDKYN